MESNCIKELYESFCGDIEYISTELRETARRAYYHYLETQEFSSDTQSAAGYLYTVVSKRAGAAEAEQFFWVFMAALQYCEQKERLEVCGTCAQWVPHIGHCNRKGDGYYSRFDSCSRWLLGKKGAAQ